MDSSDSRVFLRTALERVLGGNDIHVSDMDSLMNLNPSFDQSERAALVQLWNWIEDKDLREFSSHHHEFSRRRLEGLLASLD